MYKGNSTPLSKCTHDSEKIVGRCCTWYKKAAIYYCYKGLNHQTLTLYRCCWSKIRHFVMSARAERFVDQASETKNKANGGNNSK